MKKIGSFFSSVGGVLLGILFLGVLAVISILFIKVGVEVGKILIPWLSLAAWLVFFINLFIFIPLCLFKKTRMFAGIAIAFSSWAYGALLWFFGLLITYVLWGLIAVFIGLCIMGVGVVPVALLATLFNGAWTSFLALVVLICLTFGSRALGIYIAAKAEEKNQSKPLDNFSEEIEVDDYSVENEEEKL